MKKSNKPELLEVIFPEQTIVPWGDNKEPTPQRKLFAKFYATKGDTFCNATLSYAAAFDYDLPLKADGTHDINSAPYLVCKANGSRLMTSPGVKQMIDVYLMEQFNDTTADTRLQEILIGGKDQDSMQAIKHYNELKGRVIKKLDVSVQARPFSGLSDEELEKLAAE